jgi:hypothetical protein
LLTIYSTSFINQIVPAAGASSEVTVPTGHVYVINAMTSWQAPGTGVFTTLRQMTSGNVWVGLYPSSTSDFSYWNGRIVVPAGMSFGCYAYVNLASVTVSGFDLLSD